MDGYKVIVELKDNKHTETFANEAGAKIYIDYVKSLFKENIVNIKIEHGENEESAEKTL